jgi:hypothetical protein
MSIVAIVAIAILAALDEPSGVTDRGLPLNPALLVRSPDAYLGRTISLRGDLEEHGGVWFLTASWISAPNGLELRFSTRQMLIPLQGTSYLPRREGAFLRLQGCELQATGIFAEMPERPGRYFLLVLALDPARDRPVAAK